LGLSENWVSSTSQPIQGGTRNLFQLY